MKRDSATLTLGVGLVLLVVTLSIQHNIQRAAPLPATADTPAETETGPAAPPVAAPPTSETSAASAAVPKAPSGAQIPAPGAKQTPPAAPLAESARRDQPAASELEPEAASSFTTAAAGPLLPARREPRPAADAVHGGPDLSMPVVHRHRFGSCDGTLTASGDRLLYAAAMDDDAFEMALADIDRFELDGQSRNLRVRRRGGRTWNFTVRDGSADALVAFHRDVDRVRSRGAAR